MANKVQALKAILDGKANAEQIETVKGILASEIKAEEAKAQRKAEKQAENAYIVQAVLDALTNTDEAIYGKAILEKAGGEKTLGVSRNKFYHVLGSMVKAGQLEKVDTGRNNPLSYKLV